MGQKVISGDLNVTGAIKHNGTEINYSGTGVPTVEIAVSQVVSADPLEIQLTNDQYNVFANNKQVIIDMSALDPTLPVVIWNFYEDVGNNLRFGIYNYGLGNSFHFIDIDKTSKEATYETGNKEVEIDSIGSGHSADAGKIIAIDNTGWGTATNNLPILTTAPTSANTEGGIIIVVLSSEPANKYNGYLYLITE